MLSAVFVLLSVVVLCYAGLLHVATDEGHVHTVTF